MTVTSRSEPEIRAGNSFIPGSHTVLLWEAEEDFSRHLGFYLRTAKSRNLRIQMFTRNLGKVTKLIESTGLDGKEIWVHEMAEIRKILRAGKITDAVKASVEEALQAGKSGLFAVGIHDADSVADIVHVPGKGPPEPRGATALRFHIEVSRSG